MLLTTQPQDRMERRSRSTSRSSRSSGRKAKDLPAAPSIHLPQKNRQRQTSEARGRSSSKRRRMEEKLAAEVKGPLSADSNVVTSTVVDVDNVVDSDIEEQEETGALLESEAHEEGIKHRKLNLCEWILTLAMMLVILLSFPISIWFCLKIVREYERAVIFRLGHLRPGKARGPGLCFYLPCLDVCHKVDLRIKTFQIPFHEVVTKDMVTMQLNAVCYYRLENASLSFTAVSDAPIALQTLVQTTMKSILAHHCFADVLQNRKSIADEMKIALDAITCQWGIKVERADVKDLQLPDELRHTLAMEAEAQRLAKTRVIAAEGEKAASEALRVAADILSGSPTAVQLRYLHTLHNLSNEKASVILPLPFDLFKAVSPACSAQTVGIKQESEAKRQQKELKDDSPML
ncbi:podocin [Erpetoichthys calabaricus]|uniref:podocin n=1 Tax=Erpetoichthys calabaricus TaxID=27687 RepID=UPI0010A0B074|nr:podocin [Erpetoichthys calabaricus]